MSQSGNPYFILSRADVLEHAMIRTGRMGPGDAMSPAEERYVGEVLDLIVQELQLRKVFLWQRERTTQALTINTPSYNLASDTLDVLMHEISVLRDGVYTRVQAIAQRDYYAKPDRGTATGLAIESMITKSRTASVGSPAHTAAGLCTLTVYPMPDNSTDVLHYTRVRALQGMFATADDPDWPQRWQMTLIKLLTAEISPGMRLSLEERDHLIREAMRSEKAALEDDRQQARTRFAPRIGW